MTNLIVNPDFSTDSKSASDETKPISLCHTPILGQAGG